MKELKEKISEERKNYDKIYMKTCKIMNKENNVCANIKRMEEERRNNRIIID